MTLHETMKLLEAKGSEQTRKTFQRHGAPETMFGVKVGDLKPIAKCIRGDQKLALELYATGNSDAMYLAGLVADGSKMKKTELDRWAREATWQMISGSTVPWVAAEHPEAIEIALQWIDASKENIAVAGWGTLCCVVSVCADETLPNQQMDRLIARVVKTIHSAPNCVRYAMNNFIICCGTYMAPLAEKALAAAKKIGHVEVDMGQTACQVPEAVSYILKSRRGLPVAPKRKSARC
jgi:3-methyladenine DNA glycosylase AlkD